MKIRKKIKVKNPYIYQYKDMYKKIIIQKKVWRNKERR